MRFEWVIRWDCLITDKKPCLSVTIQPRSRDHCNMTLKCNYSGRSVNGGQDERFFTECACHSTSLILTADTDAASRDASTWVLSARKLDFAGNAWGSLTPCAEISCEGAKCAQFGIIPCNAPSRLRVRQCGHREHQRLTREVAKRDGRSLNLRWQRALARAYQTLDDWPGTRLTGKSGSWLMNENGEAVRRHRRTRLWRYVEV